MRKRNPVLPGLLLMAALLSPLFQGCDGDDEIMSFVGNSTVTLAFSGLEPLTGGLNYEAWLVMGSPSDFWGYPLVLFNLGESGEMIDPVADTVLPGPFHAGVDASGVIGVGISVEASDVLLDYSSYTFLLGGDMLQGSAELSTEHWIAFDLSLSDAGGRFILATPTDEDPANELSGIWFMDPTSVPVAGGLIIPEAPSGWNYESWVILNDQPLSMGKFVSASEPDSANLYSGTGSPPAFPGEDFLSAAPVGLTFPMDLSGRSVFVTLEPWAEMDLEQEEPFFLRILEGQVPVDAAPQTPFEMTSLTNQFPGGTATIQGS